MASAGSPAIYSIVARMNTSPHDVQQREKCIDVLVSLLHLVFGLFVSLLHDRLWNVIN
jgi:hypothetical protein